jgi:hypothetical protein
MYRKILSGMEKLLVTFLEKEFKQTLFIHSFNK